MTFEDVVKEQTNENTKKLTLEDITKLQLSSYYGKFEVGDCIHWFKECIIDVDEENKFTSVNIHVCVFVPRECEQLNKDFVYNSIFGGFVKRE